MPVGIIICVLKAIFRYVDIDCARLPIETNEPTYPGCESSLFEPSPD